MPFIDFTTGQVLTADQMDLVMRQGVMVFDNSTDRDTQLTGFLAEGMLAYLKDTNTVLQYDGTDWAAVDTNISSLDGSAITNQITVATINTTNVTNTVVDDATTARTITAADQGKIIRFTSSSAVTVTVNASTDFASGQRVDIIQDGAGVVTVTASTATVAGNGVSTTTGSFTIGDQFSAATILGLGSDNYRLIGNIEAV